MRTNLWIEFSFCLLALSGAVNLTAQDAAPASQPAPASAEQAAPTAPKAEVKEAAPAAKPTASAEALTAELQKAADKFNQSDFVGALEELKQIRIQHQELAPAHLIMAQWFAQAGAGNGVRASLEQATEEMPNDPEAYLLLGEIALRQGELTAGELLLKQGETLLAKFEGNPERLSLMKKMLLRNQISVAELRQRWAQMAEKSDAYLALEPTNAQLMRQKAVALFQQKKEEDAKAMLAKADEALKDAEEKGLCADAAMAQLYFARGDLKKANESLTAALKVNEKSRETLTLAVLIRMRENKIPEAMTFAKTLLEEAPDSVEAKRLSATLSLYLNDFATAEKQFQEIVLASPADANAVNGLALALCEQGDSSKLKRAAEYAASNVQRAPENAEFLGTLGWVLYQAKAFSESSEVMKRAISGGEINAANAYYLARLAVQSGKNAEAVQLLQAALASSQPFAKQNDARALLDQLTK